MSARRWPSRAVNGNDTYPRVLAGESLPPTPRQERSRRTREALLRAALATFEKHGYEAATIAQIARRAKVAVGAFYLHFRTKRQALLVLMDRFVFELAAVGSSGSVEPDPEHAKALVVAAVSEALRVDRKYAGVIRAWREAVLTEAGLGALQDQIDTWLIARLVAMLDLVRRAPHARPNLDVQTLAQIFHALFWRLAEKRVSGETELVLTTTAVLVHALFDDSA